MWMIMVASVILPFRVINAKDKSEPLIMIGLGALCWAAKHYAETD
jgi:hypothetical protein